MKCLICGKFCGKIYATKNGNGDIVKVWGICKTHGKVDLTNADWDYEDFED